MDFTRLWCVGRWFLWLGQLIVCALIMDKINNSSARDVWFNTNNYQYILANTLLALVVGLYGIFGNYHLYYGGSPGWTLFMYITADLGIQIGAIQLTPLSPYGDGEPGFIGDTAWTLFGINIAALYVDILVVLYRCIQPEREEMRYEPP